MPTLAVEKEILFAHMGRTYTDEAFDELCFEFGIELDEITSELQEAQKAGQQTSSSENLSTAVIYKIDVPANRYDLLCVEGLSRALRIFLGDVDAPVYTKTLEKESDMLTMTVCKQNTDQIRPVVVCAVLRDISFESTAVYNSFIDLQDQLHRNLCRNRTLVAIGTHDLDAIQPPFMYDARAPTAIEFVPLTPNDRGAFKADKLLEFYETDVTAKHLKPYVGIIKESPVYPVILDANETVLSLPPIINGSKSKITSQTKNVFIECTATDLTKANIVLDTVVTMFSEYCAKPFSVEPVLVQYQEGDSIVNSYVTPTLSKRAEKASVEFCNSLIGIHLAPADMRDLCNKVQLGPAELLENDTILQVTVPPTRSDILHAVDIAEDIGIAYGYNNIVKRVPATSTVGGEDALNQLTDLLRDEIARAGYTEVLTHGLASRHDNFTALGRDITAQAVALSNPANVEYQVVRTTLLPGLFKTLQHNKSASFTAGFKLFEISDVVLADDQHVVCETVVGAKNARRVAAVYAGPTSGFEVIHGLVDRLMTLTEVAPEAAYIAHSSTPEDEQVRVTREGWWYTIAALDETSSEAGTYFPGRAASILLTTPTKKQHSIGTFGILHPNVLKEFDIQYPASCVELDLEALL